MNDKSKRSSKIEEKRRLESRWGCDMYVCLGGKLFVGRNFLPSKPFLSVDQPRPESNFQITLSSQRQKVPDFLSRFDRAKVQNFVFSLCRLALPLGTAPVCFSGVSFMWEFLRQHGARWLFCVHTNFSPNLVATCGGSLAAPPFAQVGQNFPFHAAHLVPHSR